jgi:O-acetyl-ADP-ribose deacetylase (regulator of RNase III)
VTTCRPRYVRLRESPSARDEAHACIDTVATRNLLTSAAESLTGGVAVQLTEQAGQTRRRDCARLGEKSA